MNCKNCGARLEDNARVCQNCGVATGNIAFKEIPETYKPERNKRGFGRNIISLLLIIALVVGSGVATYKYFYAKDILRPQPELTFTTGQGVINGDESVIYAMIQDSAKIEFIHGVKLYEGQFDASNVDSDKAIASDYQYSKNVDESFRTIFFDTDALKLDQNGNYTFTFQMTFSFYEDENPYTYYETVNIKGSTSLDASNVVFDHSLVTTVKEGTTDVNPNDVTSSSKENKSFIYDNYWYTEPKTSGTSQSISAIKFAAEGTYTSTDYSKDGESTWSVGTTSGTYTLEGNTLILVNLADSKKNVTYKVDFSKAAILTSDTSKELAPKKFNSLKIVNDFFGI